MVGNSIGTINEQPLHAALKQWYARPSGQVEVAVDGFVVDVVRGQEVGEFLLIEIQTGNFSSIKRKMRQLTEQHTVHLVYPVPRKKWLVKRRDGEVVDRRKSPKRGRVEEIFKELVSFPELLCRDTFSVEVAFTEEEELRHYDPKAWRNRGWVTDERRLLGDGIVGRCLLETPSDALNTLPGGLPAAFTTADIAQAMDGPRWLAQKMAYCLRKMDAIRQIDKRGRSKLYVITGKGSNAPAQAAEAARGEMV